jgi:hypothetical protein
MYVELDVMGSGVPEWAADFGCTAERIDGSYRVSGTREQLQALLADGGYDPDTEIKD